MFFQKLSSALVSLTLFRTSYSHGVIPVFLFITVIKIGGETCYDYWHVPALPSMQQLSCSSCCCPYGGHILIWFPLLCHMLQTLFNVFHCICYRSSAVEVQVGWRMQERSFTCLYEQSDWILAQCFPPLLTFWQLISLTSCCHFCKCSAVSAWRDPEWS